MAPPKRRMSQEQEYHKRRSFVKEDIKKHHLMHGYDPLDKTFQEVRDEKRKRSSFFGGGPSPEALRKRLVETLNDHIATMTENDLSLKHAFRSARLGLSIVLARYGDEGREFIQIDGTEPFCDL